MLLPESHSRTGRFGRAWCAMVGHKRDGIQSSYLDEGRWRCDLCGRFIPERPLGPRLRLAWWSVYTFLAAAIFGGHLERGDNRHGSAWLWFGFTVIGTVNAINARRDLRRRS